MTQSPQTAARDLIETLVEHLRQQRGVPTGKMFDTFTGRAVKVMALANQEAQRFNHEYIGTEHILLGLVKEGSGVGAAALKELRIDLRKVRLEVEKLVKSGPEMVTMGKLPHTPRAHKALALAVEEAYQLGHQYVGTEHLLLGLVREGEGIASQVLAQLEVKPEDLRKKVLELLGAKDPKDPSMAPPPDVRARYAELSDAFERALASAFLPTVPRELAGRSFACLVGGGMVFGRFTGAGSVEPDGTVVLEVSAKAYRGHTIVGIALARRGADEYATEIVLDHPANRIECDLMR